MHFKPLLHLLAVHHEEFILSAVLRQEVDFDSYQIQLVSIQFAELQAAISVASSGTSNTNSNDAAASSNTAVPRSTNDCQSEMSVEHTQAAVDMRPPPPPPPTQHPPEQVPASSCVVLVSGAENRESSIVYYISSGNTITSASRGLTSAPTSSSALSVSAPTIVQEGPLTLHLPEGVSAVVVAEEPGVPAKDDGLSAARVAAADAHVVASATAALTTTAPGNPMLITESGVTTVSAATALGQSRINCISQHLRQPPPPEWLVSL